MKQVVRVEVGRLVKRDKLGIKGFVDINSLDGARNVEIHLTDGKIFLSHGTGRLVGEFIQGVLAEMPAVGTELVLQTDPDNPNRVLAWAEKPSERQRSGAIKTKLVEVRPIRRSVSVQAGRR